MAYDDIDVIKQVWSWSKWVLLAIFVLFLLGDSMFTVDAGQSGVLLTWGQPSSTYLAPGLHFKMPIAQSAVVFETRTQKYEADSSAASKDLQIVTAKIATNYHISPERVPEIYTSMGTGYADKVILPAEQESVKASTAKYTAEELITMREAVRQDIKDHLISKLKDRGIIVEEVSITNFDFSQSFNDAIEAKVTAQQLKLKAENDLARIEVEARQTIAVAEGKRNSTIAEAEGTSQATILQAQAQAEAVRLVNEQLKISPLFIEYTKAQGFRENWDGKLPTTILGDGAIPFINLNTTQ